MMDRFLQVKKNRLPEENGLAWLLAVLLALIAGRAVYFSFDPTLKNFDGRIIGITVLQGIDASSRIFQFYTIAAIIIVSLLGGYLVFSFLLSRWRADLQHPQLKIDLSVLYVLAAFTCLVVFLNVLNNFQAYNEVVIILEFLTGLDICVVIIKLVSIGRGWSLHRLFANYSINVLALFFPLVLFFIGWFVLSANPVIYLVDLFYYLLLWIAFYLGYFIIRKWAARSGRPAAAMDQALLIAAIPLLCIPATFSLDNEALYFLFIKGVRISPRLFAVGVIVFLSFLSLGLLVRTLRVGNRRFRASAIVDKVYFPIFLFTAALLVGYSPTLNYPSIDTFHFGENLIVSQQLFQFHRIPYFDILPTHGFAETIYQLLYSFVFGYRPVEANAWVWMDPVIFCLLFYFFMKKFFPPLVAFLFTWLLPIGILFSSFYSFMLVPALCIFYILENQNTFRFGVGWLVCLGMFLWRVDFGMATAAALLCIAAVESVFLLVNHEKQLFFHLVRKAIIPFVVVFGTFLFLLFLIVTLRGGNFIDLMRQNLLFVRIQSQSLSVPSLGSFSNQLILEYGILPLVAVYFIVLFMLQRLSPGRVQPSIVVLTFLAIASLFLMTRALQRHTLLSQYNPVLFAFLAVLFPVTVKPLSKNALLLMTFGIMAAYLAVFPANTQYNLVKTSGQYIHLVNFSSTQQRARYQLDSSNLLVSDFLKANLHGGQTFFDLSNDPFLYIETGKRHISYFIPNLLYTSDVVQNKVIADIERYRQKGDLPFVVFRQGSGWDAVDGVPNEVRSYRITEYIYHHYRPFVRVDRFDLWIENTLDAARYPISGEVQIANLSELNQSFDLQFLPYVWGTYDKQGAAQKSEVQQVILDRAVLLGNPVTTFPIRTPVDKQSGNYLAFRIKSPAPASITIRYGQEAGASSIKFQTIDSEEYQTYLVRVSTQWQWMSEKPNRLLIEVSAPVTIEYLAILRGD